MTIQSVFYTIPPSDHQLFILMFLFWSLHQVQNPVFLGKAQSYPPMLNMTNLVPPTNVLKRQVFCPHMHVPYTVV